MENRQESHVDPLTPDEIKRLKERDSTTEVLTPREWEQLRQQRQRPEYSET